MRALGHSGACTDETSGFAYDDGALRAAATVTEDPLRRAQAAAAQRRMIVFWHRCSPVPLLPRGERGEVTRDDPPLGPSEALVVLDPAGRLLAYHATRVGNETSRESPDPLAGFFLLAGLVPAAPAGAPVKDGTSVFDVRLDGAVPATIETDFRGGRLVEARLVAPWTPPASPPAVKFIQPDDVPNLLIIVLILASLPLARRNLLARRGEHEGARRVGLFVIGCYFGSILVGAHHTWTLAGETNILRGALAWSLYYGATAALLYLALEPLVRRVWPQRLVSWTRLIAGNVRDPMVARDVLLGMATFYALGGLGAVALALPARAPVFPVKRALEPLLGFEHCAAAVIEAAAVAVRLGLVFLLLLLLLRALGRLRWLAPAVFLGIVVGFMLALFGSLGALNPVVATLAAVLGLALLLLLARFGLLAMTAAMFFGSLTLLFPDAARLTGWTALCAWWIVGVSVVVSLYGLYFATGGRPFGDRKFLEA